MIRFEENESIVIAMFQKNTRLETIAEINHMIPFARKDGDLDIVEIMEESVRKLELMTDKEYSVLDLEKQIADLEESE